MNRDFWRFVKNTACRCMFLPPPNWLRQKERLRRLILYSGRLAWIMCASGRRYYHRTAGD